MQNRNSSWNTFKSLIATPELPCLGPTPRSSRLPLVELNRKLDGFIQATQLAPGLQPLIRSAALLWHDHLDESHAISQNIHNAEGSFLHAIMHRREPDYGNAKYWFHRVGQHASFAGIASQAQCVLEGKGGRGLASKLVPHGCWDPFAFVDACEAAAAQTPADATAQVLRSIQEVEFTELLSRIFLE